MAYDVEGKVAAKCGVTGIPQTVVIGADGHVRAVHVGFDPLMKEELEREIRASLAGEPIPSPAERQGEALLPEAEGLDGSLIRTIKIGHNGGYVRPAQLDADEEAEFAVFGRWDTVAAFDSDGRELWSVPRTTGVDDVCSQAARP